MNNTDCKCLILILISAVSLFSQAFWELNNPLPINENLKSVAYGNGKFVAVGTHGTVVSSNNGEEWQHGQNILLPNTTEDFTSIVFGDSIFVAVGSNGTIASSTDGATWIVRFIAARSLTAITWGLNQFVAVGDFTILYSSDGITWSIASSKSNYMNSDVQCDGKRFIALGVYSWYDGMRLKTADISQVSLDTGKTWSVAKILYQPIDSAQTWTEKIVTFKGIGSFKSPDTLKWVSLYTTDLSGGAYHNEHISIIVGHYGKVIKSTDAISWTSTQSFNLSDLESVAWGDSQFVAVGSNCNIISSHDATRWIQRSMTGLRNIKWCNNQFVAVGQNGIILTSTDGITWNNQVQPEGAFLYDVCWGGSKYVATGTDGLILASSDRSTWTKVESGTLQNLYSIVWGNGMFIATADISVSTGSPLFSSPDGIKWKQIGANITNQLYAITWGDTQFVAVGASGTVATSCDGNTWTLRNAGTTSFLVGVIWAKNQYIAVGSDGEIKTSHDGITWTHQSSGVTSWIMGVQYANDQFVVYGDYNVLLVSENGTAWTSLSGQNIPEISGLAWGNDRWVGIGKSYGAIFTSQKPARVFQLSQKQVSSNFHIVGNVLNYSLEKSIYLQVELLNLQGKYCGTLINRMQNKGAYTITLPSKFCNNMFILSIKTGEERKALPILITK